MCNVCRELGFHVVLTPGKPIRRYKGVGGWNYPKGLPGLGPGYKGYLAAREKFLEDIKLAGGDVQFAYDERLQNGRVATNWPCLPLRDKMEFIHACYPNSFYMLHDDGTLYLWSYGSRQVCVPCERVERGRVRRMMAKVTKMLETGHFE